MGGKIFFRRTHNGSGGVAYNSAAGVAGSIVNGSIFRAFVGLFSGGSM